MAKRISFFIGSMHNGGAERVISILANHYRRNGWDVDIALLLDTNIGYNLADDIQIIDLSQSGGSYYRRLPKWLRTIRQYVRTAKPDRIVSFVGRINVLVLTACLGMEVPIVVSERNDPRHDGRGPLMMKVCNWSYKRAKAVVYQTQYEKECFSSKLSNGVIIPNPVSVNVVPKIVERPFEIVTAGRLNQQKNQKMLVDAVAEVGIPAVSLKIFGDGNLKEDLQKRINELGINAELCGNVSNLHEQINGACIFVLSSEYEGLSNALVEAMMLGLVCISTNYPGASEVISDGENGILVPCGNVSRLAEVIRDVLSNNKLRASLSNGALKSSEKYRESSVLKQWDRVIGRCLDE